MDSSRCNFQFVGSDFWFVSTIIYFCREKRLQHPSALRPQPMQVSNKGGEVMNSVHNSVKAITWDKVAK